MNRKITRSLGALLLLTAVAVTQVPSSNVEAVVTSDFQMDGTKLVRYAGTAEVVSVPDEVRSIGEEAFADNDNIVKVSVGEKTESIGYRAFADCDNLRTITVSDSVTEIDSAAFSNDKELINVSLGAGVKNLGTGVFAGSGQLDSLEVSEDNPYLSYSDGVLYDEDMTKVYALMPNYEKNAYTLPSTVSEIRGYAFWGNPYLEYVTLGSGLYEVPAYTFSNCMNLKEVEIPLVVQSIGAKAFEDCVNLQKVKIPESVTRISDTAFDGCPIVEIEAKAGTYGSEFAQNLRKSEAEEVEYEEVQEAQVISGESVSDEASILNPAPTASEVQAVQEPSSTPETEASPIPTTQIIQESYFPPTLLGESSIVSGRAMIFIDNRVPTVLTGSNDVNGNTSTGRIDLGQMESTIVDENNTDTAENTGSGEKIENVLVENAQKGQDFPKYTIVDDTKIAAQAFYQENELTEYDIEDGITEIGEFAFARSGLTSVTIPEGVTKIGYGAFYHCDSLNNVSIPSTVTEISPYAFAQTPWQANMQTADYPFLIVGDGILIAYAGSESVINIPASVKQVGPGVFKDHMGITAVNIPDSVQIIGEEAFMGCRNLKTVNGGENLTEVRDRAFMDCPLSQVVIPAGVTEIGLGAYALNGGTDTAVFQGTQLPALTVDQGAQRLANGAYRTYALDSIKNVIISNGMTDLEGTVLEPGTYGFNGVVYDESGNLISDNQAGVVLAGEGGVALQINSQVIPSEGENAMATIPGDSGSYVLSITDSDSANKEITAAYGELYGGREPVGLSAYDISLFDASGSIPITRLGKQYVTFQVPMPSGMTVQGLHVVTLDGDGQLEAVDHRIISMEDGDYLQFTTSHFSPFGIYQYSGMNGQAVVTDGNAVITDLYGNKDDTPDTGDGLSPKWFLAFGLLAAAVALFFYKGRTVKTN